MTRYLAIIFFIILSTSRIICGQVSEGSETQYRDLSLRIKSITFVKDNEYFNNIGSPSLPGITDKSLWVEGYTLIGFYFQPELVYSPSEKVTIRAGTHFLKYSGSEKFSQIKPVFSTTLQLFDHTSLTIGSLSGSDRHRLFDPLFNSERLYTDYSEDGFQVTTSTNHLFSDNWLSWENFIVKGDSVREIFTTGESFKYTSSPVADFLQFEVPVQLQLKHFGGQISNFPEHVETYYNLATGLRINIGKAGRKYGRADIEFLQFLNGEFPGKPVSGITHGNASWYRFHYTYKAIYFGMYFWKSHNFFAPNGNSIYGSVIDTRSNYVVPDRKIITNSVYLTFMPESYLELFAGMDTYYDVCLKRMDWSFMVHLNFDKLINLATLKH
jgi:hypothetical protein